jgi:putative transposase
MKKSRYKEEQIIAVLKEVDAGAKLQDVVRRLGVSEQTYYRWKAKFGGMEVSDAKKLRALEDENRRLKTMVTEPFSGEASGHLLRDRLAVQDAEPVSERLAQLLLEATRVRSAVIDRWSVAGPAKTAFSVSIVAVIRKIEREPFPLDPAI